MVKMFHFFIPYLQIVKSNRYWINKININYFLVKLYSKDLSYSRVCYLSGHTKA